MSAPADRNLLFGILALQMDFVTRDQLVAAMNAWVLDKAKPLGDILTAQGALSPERVGLLAALMAEHLKQHGGDPAQSLAAVSSLGSARRDLEQIADVDVQANVGVAASARPEEPHDPYSTRATVGEPTSAGLRFRILRPHAEGGLGKVYVADDGELHREVALKEIEDKFADHPESRARFVVEAEITGGLEHPGIVPVYGLGSYADGRPFYAMRFIHGDSLKEAIKRFHGIDPSPQRKQGPEHTLARAAGSSFDSLEFRQLLGRFVDVCQAIAYAHSRKVLHRDLKPGNIMLGNFGETLVVDWGLAKALTRAGSVGDGGDEPPLTPASGSGTGETLPGEAIGTPEFMSPEQAAGRLDLIGPATDIYSLGVTLYAVLTGRSPIRGANVAEVLHKVERGEYPSARQVNPKAPPALAGVCGKAMALEPADRYGSALDLAKEVERWLADEPVTAWREPVGARLRRWVRKHAQLVTGVVTAVVVGAASLGVAAALLAAANKRERAAADNWRRFVRGEQEVRKIAEGSADEANALFNFVEDKIFGTARRNGPDDEEGRGVTLHRAVEDALPFVAVSFRDQPLTEARLRAAFSKWFQHFGDAKTAAEQYRMARALYCRAFGPADPRTLGAVDVLANTYHAVGRHAEAIRLFEEELGLRKAQLGRDHLYTLTSMYTLAEGYRSAGKPDLALPLYKQILELNKAKFGPENYYTINSMGLLVEGYRSAGKPDLALLLFAETFKSIEAEFGPDHLLALRMLRNLADFYYSEGRLDLALPLYEDTFKSMKADLGPDHPSTLDTMHNLAGAYLAAKEPGKALPLFGEFLAGQRQQLGDVPRLANLQASIALELLKSDQSAAAEPILRDCLAIREKAEPDAWTTFNARSMLGAALLGQQKYAEAEPLLLSGYEGLQAHTAKIPPASQIRMAEAVERLIRLYEATGRAAEAATWKDRQTDLLWDIADASAVSK